jgi:hypothetical protein
MMTHFYRYTLPGSHQTHTHTKWLSLFVIVDVEGEEVDCYSHCCKIIVIAIIVDVVTAIC